MTPHRLSPYDIGVLETTDNWTLRDVLKYVTEQELDTKITPQEALCLIAKSVKSLKYELRVTKAGLRIAQQERDKLSQRDFFQD